MSEKLDIIRLYRDEDVPDHILQEVCDLVEKMGRALSPVINDVSPNLIISAFNRFHAGVIVALVTEKGLADATRTEAIGLIKNVEHISGIEIFGSEK